MLKMPSASVLWQSGRLADKKLVVLKISKSDNSTPDVSLGFLIDF